MNLGEVCPQTIALWHLMEESNAHLSVSPF